MDYKAVRLCWCVTPTLTNKQWDDNERAEKKPETPCTLLKCSARTRVCAFVKEWQGKKLYAANAYTRKCKVNVRWARSTGDERDSQQRRKKKTKNSEKRKTNYSDWTVWEQYIVLRSSHTHTTLTRFTHTCGRRAHETSITPSTWRRSAAITHAMLMVACYSTVLCVTLKFSVCRWAVFGAVVL